MIMRRNSSAEFINESDSAAAPSRVIDKRSLTSDFGKELSLVPYPRDEKFLPGIKANNELVYKILEGQGREITEKELEHLRQFARQNDVIACNLGIIREQLKQFDLAAELYDVALQKKTKNLNGHKKAYKKLYSMVERGQKGENGQTQAYTLLTRFYNRQKLIVKDVKKIERKQRALDKVAASNKEKNWIANWKLARHNDNTSWFNFTDHKKPAKAARYYYNAIKNVPVLDDNLVDDDNRDENTINQRTRDLIVKQLTALRKEYSQNAMVIYYFARTQAFLASKSLDAAEKDSLKKIARKNYKRAAIIDPQSKLGSVKAAYRRGELSEGDGDIAKAVKAYSHAAICARSSRTNGKDLSRAHDAYVKLEELAETRTDAKLFLARRTACGDGTTQNISEAKKYYQDIITSGIDIAHVATAEKEKAALVSLESLQDLLDQKEIWEHVGNPTGVRELRKILADIKGSPSYTWKLVEEVAKKRLNAFVWSRDPLTLKLYNAIKGGGLESDYAGVQTDMDTIIADYEMRISKLNVLIDAAQTDYQRRLSAARSNKTPLPSKMKTVKAIDDICLNGRLPVIKKWKLIEREASKMLAPASGLFTFFHLHTVDNNERDLCDRILKNRLDREVVQESISAIKIGK